MSQFNENAKWRYATKKFDTTKKVSNEDLAILKEAIQLSASSFGLQLYKVIIVENPETRTQLQAASWGQSQVVDASHLLVFANQTTVDNQDVDNYLNNVATTRNLPIEALSGYGDYMKGFLGNLPEDVKPIWTSKQTYIALGNLLNAAAELKIDVTPMEGFIPAQYNEILGLDKLNLNAALVAAVGYRDAEDDTQHYAKVRKSNDDLFITL
ncbi:NAD(P)H-dependent oxidoreductase [Flavobacterium sp. SUN052]|uniref:NAD(P)H-dependent oxidoreductase n=1 Tax=Flavobacterium sp. SUN052 TaxID=3002441 RepID=UPI00237EBC54|nr:NAD(P)H-dependent oxidoreductase [Flavobacterium sp. SUN052]MEC4004924.1 NAD(P)H-dependent oxidoreductase [Flavobacterium sp. SUN052]